MKQLIVLCVPALALAGCVTEPPAGADITAPVIALQVQNSVGGAVTFKSSDPASSGVCTKVRGFPAQFSLSVSDAGGVRDAIVRMFPGDFDRASITTIDAPDVQYLVAPAGRGQNLVINLTPPSPGSVRTGLIAAFHAANEELGGPDFSMIVEAHDYAGNLASLNQIDIRAANSIVNCE